MRDGFVKIPLRGGKMSMVVRTDLISAIYESDAFGNPSAGPDADGETFVSMCVAGCGDHPYLVGFDCADSCRAFVNLHRLDDNTL